MSSLGKRLNQLRTSQNLTQVELAQKIEISQSNISRIEKDEIAPSSNQIIQICIFFNVSSDWLLMGDSNRNISIDNHDESDALKKDELTIEQDMLLNSYDKMTTKSKKTLQKFARDLVEADLTANSGDLSRSVRQKEKGEGEDEITATKVG